MFDDLDKDGVPEIIICESGFDGLHDASGIVIVLSGKNGQRLLTLSGRAPNKRFGVSICVAPDVTGDGTADFLVGSSGATEHTGELVGEVALVSGSAGTLVKRAYAKAPGDGFGASVVAIGDVDNDGKCDFAVGASGAGREHRPQYVQLLSGADLKVIREIAADPAGGGFGLAVAGVGDVNADGISDVAIGQPYLNKNLGRVAVFSGRDGRLVYAVSAPSNTRYADQYFGASLARLNDVSGDGVADLTVGGWNRYVKVLSGVDGKELFITESRKAEYAMDGFGQSIAVAGDLNGDGVDDLAIGCNEGGWDDDRSDSYEIRLVSGRDGSTIRSIDQGQCSVARFVDVDGDNVPDILAACPYEGLVRVLSGASGETLRAFIPPAAIPREALQEL